MLRAWTIAAAVSLVAAQARALTPGCTPITQLPFTIQASGVYCLTSDLTTTIDTGNAIRVDADNVVLDLAGFDITGPTTDLANHARGIFAVNRQNLRIYGGGQGVSVIRGFRYGILIADQTGASRGHEIVRVHVQNSRAVGISVVGEGTLIADARVTGTTSPEDHAVGISVTGSGAILRRNQVTNTVARTAGGYAAGMDLSGAHAASVSGNEVQTVGGRGLRYGILCGAPFQSFNVVSGAAIPFGPCIAAESAAPYPYPYPVYPYPFTASNHPGGAAVGGALLAIGSLGLAALARGSRFLS